MTRGTRIAAVDADTLESVEIASTTQTVEPEEAETASEASWDDKVTAPRRSWFAIIAGGVSVLCVAGWTVLFVIANLAEMQAGGSLAQWTNWIRDWSVPVLLVAVAWLLGMRNSRREALRFGEAARLLGEESARLEDRLTTVNRTQPRARVHRGAVPRYRHAGPGRYRAPVGTCRQARFADPGQWLAN